MAAARHGSGDSASFVLPARSWRKHLDRPGRSALLLTLGLLAAAAGLVGALRHIAEFQHLDFTAIGTPSGCLVVEVAPRSGAARAGLAWGDVVVAVDSTPVSTVDQLESLIYARRVAVLSVTRGDELREVVYYSPPPRVDVRYLLVAFAAMFTLVVAGLVYISEPTAHAGKFLALAEALFVAIAIPLPLRPEPSWQVLLLIRDFGRLALPPLLIVFFASFPSPTLARRWQVLAFLPSVLVAAARAGLAVGLLPPVTGNVLLPEALDGATAFLVILGIGGAAVLGVRAFIKSRDNPTRRRQVEWVALGAAAGFTPYLLLSVIPQLAGAELEVLTWISLLPLALVPLGVASSLLEFRLWDLEDISRQVIATGFAVLIGGVTFALLNYGITRVGFELGNWRNLVAVVGGILLVALTVPARRLLLDALERFQYRERLASRRALTTFAEEAAGHRDPRELLDQLRMLLKEALAVDRVVTYLARGDTLLPSSGSTEYPPLSPSRIGGPFPSPSEEPLRAAGIWHRFVMEGEDRVIGIVYCGRRHGELPLGHGERRLVSALAAQAALALENALLLEDLRHQVEEHRLLEDYLERIFESSAAALLVCDVSGWVLRANQRAGKLLSQSTRRLAGKGLSELVELPEEWQESLPAGVAGIQVRFAVDGEIRTGLLSTSALEIEPGRFDGRVVALEDISEQLALEQRLAEQERLASLGRLAAGLAHEVNTPVTGIASYAQLLREMTDGDDPRHPFVEKLEEQSFRVARIVTNLLELARPSGFDRQPVDLAAVAREEVIASRATAEAASVVVSCRAEESVTVEGNRVQLELVVHNLVRNAIQATPEDGRVDVIVGEDDGTAWAEVADTGPGVPPELADKIFQPFVTTRAGRGGTGLGLAITRDIVVAHGGSIGIRPNEPSGTVIRIEMPSALRGDT